MGKKHKRLGGVPRPKSQAAKARLLEDRLRFILGRTIMYRDVLQEGHARLARERRLTKQAHATLKIQIATLNAVIFDCLRSPPDEVSYFQTHRDKKLFEQEVEKMMNAVTPRIITPQMLVRRPERIILTE